MDRLNLKYSIALGPMGWLVVFKTLGEELKVKNIEG